MINNQIIKESAGGYNSVGVEELLLSNRKIFFDSDVNSESCNVLIQKIMLLNSESQDEITIYINSPGGVVDNGLAAYDAMRMSKAPIKTVCTGLAASMGATLFLGGDTRLMMPHTRLMIHDPSYGGGDMGGLKPDQIQKLATSLKEVRSRTNSIIAERTGKPISIINKITKDDTFFNAEQAIEMGLATGIANEL